MIKRTALLLFILIILSPLNARPQMRGVWVATVENIDWPSAPGLTAEQQKKELSLMLSRLAEMGFNAVFLQVRPAADTFWPSKLEPWSFYLTGAQGKSPGYDPLAFAIEEAHKNGLELHAWVNPFRVKMSAKTQLSKNHPAIKNKEWVIDYNGKSFYDPGNPAARRHSINVIAEIAKNYKVDGIHMDDYFYPYPDAKNTPVNDAASFKKHAKKGQSRDDWRRENINTFIKDLRAELKKADGNIVFGISPFGIWCNAKDCEGGSDTGGFNANLKLYADSRSWLKNGLVDYIAPQLYWHTGHKTASFKKLADWWDKETGAAQGLPKLYIGIAAYRHASGEWKDKSEIEKQVKYAQGKKNVDGFIYFSAGKVLSDKRDTAAIIKKINKQK